MKTRRASKTFFPSIRKHWAGARLAQIVRDGGFDRGYIFDRIITPEVLDYVCGEEWQVPVGDWQEAIVIAKSSLAQINFLIEGGQQ